MRVAPEWGLEQALQVIDILDSVVLPFGRPPRRSAAGAQRGPFSPSLFSPIGHGTVPNAVNVEGTAGLREKQPVVAYTQADFASVLSLELLDVALSSAGKAEQSVKDAPGSGLVEVADVGAGAFRPLNLESHFSPPNLPG
jgi:hypothetical protein